MNWVEDMVEQSGSETYPLVFRWGQAMEAKLGNNRYKGDREGWLTCTPEWLLDRLREEVAELDEAMRLAKDPICVADECIDISNFAMMVADSYIHAFKDSQKKSGDAPRHLCDGSPDRVDDATQSQGEGSAEGLRQGSPQDGARDVRGAPSDNSETTNQTLK